MEVLQHAAHGTLSFGESGALAGNTIVSGLPVTRPVKQTRRVLLGSEVQGDASLPRAHANISRQTGGPGLTFVVAGHLISTSCGA